MKSVLIGVFLLVFSLTLQAQKQDEMYHYSTDFTLSEHNFVDTIPIIYQDNQVYLEVKINGKKHLFNLDTGSSQGVLYAGEAIPYIKTLGSIKAWDANGQTDTIPMVTFPTLVIGHLCIEGYKGTLAKRQTGRYAYDGIIGFDLFNKGLLAKIDTQQGYLILTDRKDFFKNETGFELKYRLQRWVPYLLINTFDKHEELTLFDTGADAFFAFNKANFDKARHQSAHVAEMVEETTHGQQAIGSFGTEKSDLLFYIKLDRLLWGKYAFRNVHTFTSQGDSRIGGEILRYGAIVIDPKRKRMKLQPYLPGNFTEVNNKMVDITYVPIDNRATVGTIRHRSRQYRQGFRQGDVILRINDMPINTFADFQQYHFVKGARYTFQLHSLRGFDKEVVVERWGED